ncbi:MAG: RimK/LysX family protein [Candidatus Woesearchaeota archaeon]|jgi:hypothetical protein|nr:RimK/LysX family protein [Candidatus Woesearchaeota archaeon]
MVKKKERLVIGLVETVILEGKKYKAKIDTGADSSSIDESIAFKLGSKEIVSHKIIRSALGRVRRPTVMIDIEFQGKIFHEKITIANRTNLKYKILIGQDILKREGFLIDPNK